MQKLAGLEAAWDIWEKALAPALLSGAGSWIGEIKTTTDVCNMLQDFFWKTMLELPSSCPKVALQCETGMMDMLLRINLQKCLLLIKIKDMEVTSLAREIWLESLEKEWPGLAQDVR